MRQEKLNLASFKDLSSSQDLLKVCLNSHKAQLRLAVLCGVLNTFFLCVQWGVLSYLVQSVVVEKTHITDLSFWVLILVAAAIMKAITTKFQTHFSESASSNICLGLREALLSHWNKISPCHLHTSPAASATQLIDDVNSMEGYFSRYWPQQMLSVISPLMIFLVVLWINWLCALLLLIAAPLIPMFMILIGMGAETINERHMLLRQRLSGHFLNRIQYLQTIKLLGATAQLEGEIQVKSEQYRNVIMRTLKVAFLSSTVLEFFTSIAIASLAMYIGFSLYGAITWGPAEEITLFSGLFMLLLAPEFFQPLRILSQYYHDKASAVGAANNLLPHFLVSSSVDISTPIQERPFPLSINSPKPELHLKDVWVGIPGESVLAKDINLSAKGGQIIVVSGPSGIGKTTLLNSLVGYLAPIKGQINIVPPSNFAYLPQRPWFKDGTILDNILALAPLAEVDEIWQVLERLGLKQELSDTNRGLDTVLGDQGLGLSGGQLQRIALSRILLNPSPIIILDEPTAKLDKRSRNIVIDVIQNLAISSIVVIATHDHALIEIAEQKIDFATLHKASLT
jgi:ATP-binding cassette subfamily C protein CydD